MKKNIIIIAIIAIITLIIFAFCIYIMNNLRVSTTVYLLQEEKEEVYANGLNTVVEEINENEIENIEIYDIEDGYLTVKYNTEADKHEYNWDKLDNSTQYYKYEDDKYKTVLGIDVSEYQGYIDWEKVKEAGISFAILRLGFRGYGQAGRLVFDEKFEEYYQGAIDNGIEVGLYFFSQSVNIEEIREEADFILSNIEGKQITYPIVFDLEKIKNDDARTDILTPKEITDLALEFYKVVENNGYTACIYGNSKTFTTRMEIERLNECNKWYADYLEKPLYPYEFSIWQYTEAGSINGIEGNVDLNLFFLDK